MANWGAFLENIRDTSSGLGDYARQEKAKQDAFQMLLLKAAIEQKIKQTAMQRNLETLRSMGFNLGGQQIDSSIMPGSVPSTQQDYQTIVEPKMDTEGGLSFGFKRSLTPEAETRQKIKEAKEVKKAQMTEEMNVKRSAYKKDLDNFMAIDNILHEARGESMGRFGAGAGMVLKGVSQKTKLGQAVGAYDAVSKRLRVQLVRAAGDVGNINIVEQQAAEKLIPSKFDSKGTADIKRAYLNEISKAIDSGDASEVKDVLDKIGIDYIETNKDYSNLWE